MEFYGPNRKFKQFSYEALQKLNTKGHKLLFIRFPTLNSNALFCLSIETYIFTKTTLLDKIKGPPSTFFNLQIVFNRY